jgi:hypothetical protein
LILRWTLLLYHLTLVSPSGMVETPRLEAKRKLAKCEQREHEPSTRTNLTIPSYPRKRVSRWFFSEILFWIPASAGMTKKRELGRKST